MLTGTQRIRMGSFKAILSSELANAKMAMEAMGRRVDRMSYLKMMEDVGPRERQTQMQPTVIEMQGDLRHISKAMTSIATLGQGMLLAAQGEEEFYNEVVSLVGLSEQEMFNMHTAANTFMTELMRDNAALLVLPRQ